MQTITLIDLFIKIAKDEDTPNLIKFKGNIFTTNGMKNNYYCEEKNLLLEESFVLDELNDEVEIIK